MTRIAHRQILAIKQHLKTGGLIAYPTESCFGFGCLPNHARALSKLIRLKKRPQHKGMIVVGDTLQRFNSLLKPLSTAEQAQLTEQWPAAITFLLPAKPNTLAKLRGKSRQKLAVRVPNHQQTRQLSHLLQSPLVSTSANKAGKKACKTARDVKRQFGHQLLIIQGRIGDAKKPSQIIDFADKRIIRK